MFCWSSNSWFNSSDSQPNPSLEGGFGNTDKVLSSGTQEPLNFYLQEKQMPIVLTAYMNDISLLRVVPIPH